MCCFLAIIAIPYELNTGVLNSFPAFIFADVFVCYWSGYVLAGGVVSVHKCLCALGELQVIGPSWS